MQQLLSMPSTYAIRSLVVLISCGEQNVIAVQK